MILLLIYLFSVTWSLVSMYELCYKRLNSYIPIAILFACCTPVLNTLLSMVFLFDKNAMNELENEIRNKMKD